MSLAALTRCTWATRSSATAPPRQRSRHAPRDDLSSRGARGPHLLAGVLFHWRKGYSFGEAMAVALSNGWSLATFPRAEPSVALPALLQCKCSHAKLH